MKRFFTFLVLIFGVGIQSVLSQDVCGGRICNSDQYCEDTACVDKKDLSEICTAVGQCKTANSECSGDEGSMTCKCNDPYWAEGPGSQCVYACTAGKCNKGLYCSTVWPNACLPQLNLNTECDANEPDLQCKPENAACDPGSKRCMCKSEFLQDGNMCIAKCKPGECQEPDFEYCDANGSGKCERKNFLGEDCPQPDACMTLNSECVAGVCDCKLDFVNYHNSACLPKCTTGSCSGDYYCTAESYCAKKANFNQPCDDAANEDQCADNNTSCQSADGVAKCLCAAGFGEFNGQCVKACDDNTLCDAELFCNPSKVCETRRNLGQQCSVEGADECIGIDVACKGTPAFCNCNDDFYQNGNICVAKCTSNDVCDTDTEFCNLHLGRCNPKVDLNGICNPADDSPCKTAEATCDSVLSQCKCTSEFVENAGTCIDKCKSDGDCTTDRFCNSKEGTCDMRRSLNETCSTDEANANDHQCKDAGAECSSEGLCSCAATHVEVNQMCVERCTSSSTTCTTTEYCDFENDVNICRPKVPLNTDCQYADQCADANATCDMQDTKKCQCSQTHYNYNGMCREKCSCQDSEYCADNGECRRMKPLGGTCSEDRECKNEGATCDGVCKCTTDHHQETDICILKCTKDNKVCDELNEFCFMLEQRCFPKAGFNDACMEEGVTDECIGKLTNCLRGEGQKKTCQCTPNAQETAGSCECVVEFVENRNSTKCLKVASELEEECEEDIQCTEIGEGDTGAICNAVDSMCACPMKFVSSQNKKRCLLVASNIGDDCEEPQQCFSLTPGLEDGSGTECLTSNTCACNDGGGYLNSTSGIKCLKKASQLEEECEETSQCSGIGDGDTGAICNDVDNMCECPSRSVPSANKLKCLKIAENLEESCEVDEQCVELGGSGNATATCNINKCSCQNGFVGSSNNKICLMKATELEQRCDETVQCSGIGDGTTGATCSDSTCTCPTRSVTSTNKLKCLKVADNLEEACEVNGQCADFGNSECSSNKCSCSGGFIAATNKTTCLKLAGAVEEACDEPQQCSNIGDTETEVECTENKCKCRSSFLESADKKTCVKSDGNTGGASPVGRFDAITLFLGIILVLFTNFV